MSYYSIINIIYIIAIMITYRPIITFLLFFIIIIIISIGYFVGLLLFIAYYRAIIY